MANYFNVDLLAQPSNKNFDVYRSDNPSSKSIIDLSGMQLQVDWIAKPSGASARFLLECYVDVVASSSSMLYRERMTSLLYDASKDKLTSKNKTKTIVYDNYDMYGDINGKLSTTGSFSLTVSIKYRWSDKPQTDITTGGTWAIEEFDIPVVIKIQPQTLSGISVNSTNVKRSYYINEKASIDGLIVKYDYRYAISKEYSHSVETQTYDYQFGSNEVNTLPILDYAGWISVKISYRLMETYYYVNVIGLDHIEWDGVSKTNYRVGENYDFTGLTATSYYLNGATASYEVTATHSINKNVAGRYNVTLSFYDEKIQETNTKTISVYYFDLQRIDLVLDNVKQEYSFGETLDTTGLSAIANFGNADPLTLSLSDLEVRVTSIDEAHQDIKISYTYGGVTKSANYSIVFYGTYAIELRERFSEYYDIESQRLRFQRGTRINNELDNLRCYILSHTKNDGYTEEAYSGTVANDASPDISDVVGLKNVQFWISLNDRFIRINKGIVIWDYNEMKVEPNYVNVYVDGTPDIRPYVDNGSNVIAKTTDGKIINNFTDYYIANGQDTKLNMGNNEITLVANDNNSVTCKYNINLIPEAIADDATLIVTPKYTNNIFKDNDVVSPDLFDVRISKMLSGETNHTTNSFVITLYHIGTDGTRTKKSGTIFAKEDMGGNYEVEISITQGNKVFKTSLEDYIILDYATSVSMQYNKSIYLLGEKIDKNQISGTATFLSGDTKTITQNDISNFNATLTLGAKSYEYYVTIGHSSFKEYYSITTLKMFQSSLVLSNKNYYINDVLDTNGAKLVINYTADGTNVYSGKPNLELPITSQNLSKITWIFEDSTFNVITNCKYNSLQPIASRNNADVWVSATYTENGVTTSVNNYGKVNIKVLAIKTVNLVDIETDGEVLYLNVNYDKRPSLNGLKIVGYLNDDSPIEVTNLSEYKLMDTSTNTEIQYVKNTIYGYILYTYSTYDDVLKTNVVRDTKRISVNVYCISLDSLVVDYTGFSSQVYSGGVLDITPLTFKAKYISSNDNDGTYPRLVGLTLNDINATLNGYQFFNGTAQLPYVENVTSQILSLSYSTVNSSVTLTINPIRLLELSFETDDTFKELDSYVERTYLDLKGLKIYGRYNNSENLVEIKSGVKYYLDNTLFNLSTLLSYAPHNGKTLSATFDGKSIDIGYLEITPRDIIDVSVEKNPTITTYTYGDKFTINGLQLRVTYNNGDEDLVSYSDRNIAVTNEVVNSIFDNEDFTTEETKTITVSYTYNETTLETSFDIYLVMPTLKRLDIDTSNVPKTFYDKTDFIYSGLSVKAIYENGYSETLDDEEYTIDATSLRLDSDGKIQIASNGLDYGRKKIYLTYENPYKSSDSITSYYEVDVTSSKEIISALLVADETQNPFDYEVGERFTARGFSFKTTDIDGNVSFVSDFTTSPEIDTLLRVAQRLEVTFTYHSGTRVFTEKQNILVNVKNKIDITETNDYNIAFGYDNNSLFTELNHNEDVIKLGEETNCYPIISEDKISIDLNPLHENTYGMNVYSGNNLNEDAIGYMDLGETDDYGNVIKNAHIVLFDDPLNPIEADGNVEVTYPHYIDGYADRINKSRFGIVYNNRLFVSGNPNYKNIDWHTEETNDRNNLFTYFSDLSYCSYGTDETAIIGYDIYKDGDLIIVKETSRREATLYRREAKIVTATDYAGNSIVGSYEDAYPSYPINSNGGIGGISENSVVNFMGDTLFLTRNGLKLLASNSTTYNNEKSVFDVSTYINTRVTKENLEKSHLFIFGERLLFKTNRGLYVGEYNLLNDETKEYEWYFLDNIDADIFFEYEEELYFANNSGAVCKFLFDEEDYIDRKRTFIGLGGTLLTNIEDDNDGFEINETTNSIILSARYANEVENGKTFHLLTTYKNNEVDTKSLIHSSLGNFVENNARIRDVLLASTITSYVGVISIENNTIEIKPFNADNESIDNAKLYKYQDLYYDGRKVYLDHLVGDGINASVDTEYTLRKVNDNIYKLFTEYGEELDLIGITTMRISFVVNELSITTITDVEPFGNNGAVTFKLYGDHNRKLDLIYYNDRNDRYSGIITSENEVQSFFITKPFDFGTIIYDKTIHLWTIANDTQLASVMNVGVISSRKQGDFEMLSFEKGASQLDFNKFAFDKVQFLNDNLPHIFTKYKTLPAVNCVRFVFKNGSGTNMVLGNLSLMYTIIRTTRGVN